MDTAKRAGPPEVEAQDTPKKIARGKPLKNSDWDLYEREMQAYRDKLARDKVRERIATILWLVFGVLFVILPAVCVAVRIWLGEQPS